MAGVTIKVNVAGPVGLLAAVRSGLDPQRLLRAIGLRQLRWISDNFRSEGGLDGSVKWPPLKPSTVLGRRGGSSAVLQDTGRLKQSFDSSLRTTGNSVLIGSNVEYAEYHQTGTGPYEIRPKNKRVLANRRAGLIFGKLVHHPGLPPRPMLPPEAVAGKLAARVVEAAVKRALDGRGSSDSGPG